LLFQGVNDLEDLDSRKNNPSYAYLLQANYIPSKEVLRQRFDILSLHPEYKNVILKTVVSALKLTHTKMPETKTVQLKDTLWKSGQLYQQKRYLGLTKPVVTLDLDVSPFDNFGPHKKGVERIYKGRTGYSPNFMYLSSEGYLINVELNSGKTHDQKGTPDFLESGLKQARQITHQDLCLRMDSRNDNLDNLQICHRHQVDYVIKRNLQREDSTTYLNYALSHKIQAVSERKGKVHYDFSRLIQRSIKNENGETELVSFRQVNRVTVRNSEANGEINLIPEIEVESYWTSLPDNEEVLIALYHNHTLCKQFHNEIKNDLGAKQLPSGKFTTNELVLYLTALAYNLLRLIGQRFLNSSTPTSGSKSVTRLRLKSILKHIM